jgi:hypothetical protein
MLLQPLVPPIGAFGVESEPFGARVATNGVMRMTNGKD